MGTFFKCFENTSEEVCDTEVFIWYCRTRGRGRDLRTVGRSLYAVFQHKEEMVCGFGKERSLNHRAYSSIKKGIVVCLINQLMHYYYKTP
jgi:hypothetical protein